MSKAYSQHLFDLIKSLSKSEKRYFKIFTLRHATTEGDNKNVRLFDMIDRQHVYDEKKIMRGMSLTKKQLSNRKKYLYELILKSEENYCPDDTAEKKVKKSLVRTKILFDKGLYQQCLKLLGKAKTIAAKYEKHLLLFELLGWEETIFRRMYNIQDLEKQMRKNFKTREQVLEKITTINKYRKLYSHMYLISNKTWTSRSPEDIRHLRVIIDNPLMKNEKLAVSYEARVSYYYIRGLYFFYTGEMKKTYRATKKRVIIIEQHPHHIAENPADYIAALLNLAESCNDLGKNEEFLNTLKKLQTLSAKAYDLQNKLFPFAYQLELSHYIKNGQFQKGIALTDEIKKGFERFGDKLDKHFKLQLQYSFSVLYFATAEYHAALTWLNTILNDPEKDLRKDIYCFTRILNLIVHFELGNQELLQSAVKSTYRLLHKKERLFSVETAVLNFIRNEANGMNTSAKRIEAFKELRKETARITKSDFEKKALDYFDIISWVESKIENRPFAEIVREKALI